MDPRDFLQRLRQSSSRARRAQHCQPYRHQPRLEYLEDRTLPAARLSLNGTQALLAGANINVSNSTATLESEMSVDINPVNPLNIAGFTYNIANLNQINVFFSTNGGVSWTRTTISDSGAAGVNNDGLGFGTRADPSIAFDANGNLFIAYGFHAGTSTRLVAARSTDGGQTFTQFTVVDQQPRIGEVPGLDKWHLATGRASPSTTTQAVYVAYSQLVEEAGGIDQRIVVAGSNDGGVTFTTPIVINDNSLRGTSAGNSFADPAVGPNGELYVAWHDHNGAAIRFDRDLDGLWTDSNTFNTDITVRNLTFSLIKYSVPAQPNRGIFTGPVLDVDRSGGSFQGRLYLTFVDRYSGMDTDIFLTSSTNSGATWTSFGTIGNVEAATSTDFLPWVDVDQATGSVNVVYYTTDGDQATGNDDVHVRLASSINGGASFSRANLTSARSRASAASYPGNFLEYIGLVVHNGTAHGFWSDNRGQSSDLEAYTASAALVSLSGGNTLRITGDDNGVTDDRIQVRRSPANAHFAEVWVNGQMQFAGLWDTLDSITIDAGAGQDTIDLESSPLWVTMTINAGDGNDTIQISPGANNLEQIGGNVTINGGAGSDTVRLFDQADRFSDAYTLTATTVSRNLAARISYATVESLAVSAGTGNNTFHVEGTAAGVAVTVDAGAGNDTFNLSPGANLLVALLGPLTLQGGAGTDTLMVHDEANTSHDTFTLTATTVTRSSAALATYGTLEAVVVYAGTGNNTFNIHSTAASTTVMVYGGAGNDTFYLSPTANYLDPLRGSLTIHGDAGSDTLNVHDQANPFTDTYALTAATISRAFAATITYGTFENVVLNAGSGRNTINVHSLAAGTSMAVNAGAGNDTIQVSPLENVLTSLAGSLTVNGGTGADTLQVHDEANPVSDAYAFTATTLASPSAGLLTYGTLESVVLSAGSGHSTFTIEGTATGSTLTINAGAGHDTFEVGNPANTLDALLGTLILNGQGNTDVLNIADQGTSTGKSYTLGFGSVARSRTASIFYGTVESVAIQTGSGNDTITTSSISTGLPVMVHAGAGLDTLAGTSSVNTWNLTGTNAGTLNVVVAFAAVENLSGGLSADTFVFSPGQGVTGTINGQGGSDTLSYTAYTTAVAVNLLTGSATGVGGSISSIENVFGGAGHDLLRGDALANLLLGGGGHDLLLGGAGNDALEGGSDRDVLIGGLGSDLLQGGQDDDILIDGSTSHDGNDAVLLAILAEWVRTDRSYDERVQSLRSSLNATTVVSDGVPDALFGQAGADWFWADILDRIDQGLGLKQAKSPALGGSFF